MTNLETLKLFPGNFMQEHKLTSAPCFLFVSPRIRVSWVVEFSTQGSNSKVECIKTICYSKVWDPQNLGKVKNNVYLLKLANSLIGKRCA